MRVVLLTSGVRGIGTYCMNLHNELLANGHDVLLVSERKWEKTLPASFYQAKSVLLFGVVPIVYKPGEAMREILNFKPDLIHYHWPSGEMAYFLRRFEALDVPVLTTIHVSLASRENVLDRVWYRYFSRLKKWIPGVDMVNCISGFIRDQLHTRMEISPSRVTQIYAGVNDKVFTPIPKERGAALELLFIGAISPEKGIDVLLKAVEAAGRSREIRLTIVGSGPLERKLRHETRNNPDIRWIGFLKEQRQIAEYYAGADATVMPTRWEEAFSLVPVESLSCGTPVIATAKGGTPEIVLDGVTGHLLSACDVAELTAVLQSLDLEALRAMRKACRELVLKRHTIAMMGENHLSLYERMLVTSTSR